MPSPIVAATNVEGNGFSIAYHHIHHVHGMWPAPGAGLIAASDFSVNNVSNCAIAMTVGMVVILAGMAAMIVGEIPAAAGEQVFFAGLATFLAGVICAARKTR